MSEEKTIPERWSGHYLACKSNLEAARADGEMGGTQIIKMQLIEELGAAESKLARLPADWWTDSSLKTWFPFTAEELQAEKRKFEEHTRHVGRFLSELYSTMVDPVGECDQMKISDLCEILLTRAADDRESMREYIERATNAESQLRATDEVRLKLVEALELIEHKADQRLQGQYTEKQILGVILHTARTALLACAALASAQKEGGA